MGICEAIVGFTKNIEEMDLENNENANALPTHEPPLAQQKYDHRYVFFVSHLYKFLSRKIKKLLA